MSLTIHCKYKCFDSTVQGAEDRPQKFHFCHLPFAVNVMLNLSINASSVVGPSIRELMQQDGCKTQDGSMMKKCGRSCATFEIKAIELDVQWWLISTSNCFSSCFLPAPVRTVLRTMQSIQQYGSTEWNWRNPDQKCSVVPRILW